MDCNNMGWSFIVSLLISQFEETIASDILLAALMPVVALVGGNSGAQSLAIVIRALARNDVSDARVFEVIGKQTFIGIINGIFVGVLSFLILIFNPINFNNLIIVNMSSTNGTFTNLVFEDKIVAAKIGKEAFLDPDIEILPDNSFFPLINNFLH